MATKSKLVLTKGYAIKKEAVYLGASDIHPGYLVMPTNGGVTLPTANFNAQIAVADYTSVDGFQVGNPASNYGYVDPVNATDNPRTTYSQNDQIPYWLPTNGCEVMLVASAAIAAGAFVGALTTGMVATVSDAADAVGIARQAATASGEPVLVEILK